ncbi:MAG: CGGC domain-containing protein [Phycisphaerales bacterium]|jgi:predicted metal-binding protein
MREKDYIVVVQCHIVKERCSGYMCEYTFAKRKDLFSEYPGERDIRFLNLTCGGCCGRAGHRKLSNLIKTIKKKEGIDKEKIGVHLASCVSFDSYHGPPWPHKEYLRKMICDKLGLDLTEGSTISEITEKRRAEGVYESRPSKKP